MNFVNYGYIPSPKTHFAHRAMTLNSPGIHAYFWTFYNPFLRGFSAASRGELATVARRDGGRRKFWIAGRCAEVTADPRQPQPETSVGLDGRM